MNFVKKMCILRQVKQGFSGDGRTLSGLIKIEQYGKNLSVEVSVINFAPLSSGEYYCLLADPQGRKCCPCAAKVCSTSSPNWTRPKASAE